MSRSQKTILVMLFVMGLSVRIFFAWASSPNDLLRFIPDDALINFSVGDHWAHGKGFSADGLHYTNSVHYLAVLASAPFYRLFPHDKILPIRCALTVASFFAVATALFLFGLIRHFSSTPGAIAGVFLWLTSPLWFTVSMAGMDSPFTIFFVSASLYCYLVVLDRGNRGNGLHYALLGLLLGLATVSRSDQALLALLIGFDMALRLRRNPKRLIPRAGFFWGAILIPIGIITCLSVVYSGQWMSSSIKLYNNFRPLDAEFVRVAMENAKNRLPFVEQHPSLVFHLLELAASIWFFFLFSPWGVCGSLSLLCTKAIRSGVREAAPGWGPLYILLIVSAVFFFTYVFYFNNFYQYRYLTPVFLSFAVFAGMLLGLGKTLYIRSAFRKRMLGVLMSMFVVAFLVIAWNYRLPMDADLRAAEWIESRIHDEEGFACASLAGTMGYFVSHGRLVDLVGKLDYGVIEAYKRGELEAYLNARNVVYLIEDKLILRLLLRLGGAEQFFDREFEQVAFFPRKEFPIVVYKRKTFSKGIEEPRQDALPGSG